MPSDKSHGIESLGKAICCVLDPGFKANHRFSIIRKEYSSCSQKNLLEKMRT